MLVCAPHLRKFFHSLLLDVRQLSRPDSACSYLTFQRRSHFEWEQLSFNNSLLSHLQKMCDTGLAVQLRIHRDIW